LLFLAWPLPVLELFSRDFVGFELELPPSVLFHAS
jgi:hypothetical protein